MSHTCTCTCTCHLHVHVHVHSYKVRVINNFANIIYIYSKFIKSKEDTGVRSNKPNNTTCI